MKQQSSVAFVFGRPFLNAAKLQFMPFALSTLKKLAENKNLSIDVYITQTQTKDYEALLPDNVKVIFLDNKFVWSKGAGIKLYILLNMYFNFLTRKRKYNSVIGVGQVGVVLGGKLAHRKSAKFICLNDEFPDISYLKVWRENEKIYTSKAHTIILPDESRVEVLKKQINFSSQNHFSVLPNMPLQDDLIGLPNINWQIKLDISDNSKLIIYNGGIDKENNIDFLLTVFPFTPDEFVLVMVGNGKKYSNNRYLIHERIIWINEPLSDNELHSLLKTAICTIAYYADFLDLEYVGKSSGKIMRSLLVETPVITTNFDSLKFIEEDHMGVLITKPFELISAIQLIDKNLSHYKKNIRTNIHKYTFEKYWDKMSHTIL